MPSETELIKLYSDKILQMAAKPIYRERLSEPDASATKRSPLCGSAVTVDINIESGVIELQNNKIIILHIKMCYLTS